MKIQIHSHVILVNILYFCTYCLSNEIALSKVNWDALSIIKELRTIINILSAEKQLNNEDVSLNITQLIVKYGYPVQEHHVKTDDGYILTMFRIPGNGPVVFLMHGLLMSSDDWITGGLQNSLAYLLATAGYDVWMGNARGNKHSRQHVSILQENPTFWDFSWHEIGREDLPAMIDYVLNTTNKTQLAYIGHSQGTTTFFVMCSEKPEYNKKISTMIALSPIAWMVHAKNPIPKFFAPFHTYGSFIVKLFHVYEIFPKPIVLKYSQIPICEIGNGIICSTFVFLVSGFDYEQLNITNLPVTFNHLPSGASAKQFLHYLQNIASGTFSKYDYDENKNQKLYGTRKPPEYEVDKINAPVALFYGDNDWFCDVEDVTILKNKLPNVTDVYRVPFEKFNHIDFIWAKDVKRLMHANILDLLRSKTKTIEN